MSIVCFYAVFLRIKYVRRQMDKQLISNINNNYLSISIHFHIISYTKMNFNNAEPIEAKDAEKDLKKDYPGLLLQDERIDLAFKATRDKFFFTSHRILIRDKHGITGKY